MTRKLIPTRTAYAAIAAALAFSATPLLAQDAAPAIVLPDFSTATTPAPAPSSAPSMVASPVVQPVPVADEPAAVAAPVAAPAAATPRTPSATAPARPAAISRAQVQAQPVAAPPAAAPVAETGFAPTGVPTAAPVAPLASVPEPVPADATIENANDEETGALLAAGAVMALGLLGFAAFRRSQPAARQQAVPVVERPRVAAAAVVTAAPLHVAAQPTWQRAPAASLHVPSSGGVVPLPRTMPDRFEDRDVLLRRMVAARPDRANPFRSPKARHHRAKLILQSLSQDFADREPNIDLSDYPGNWPIVARRKYATAA